MKPSPWARFDDFLTAAAVQFPHPFRVLSTQDADRVQAVLQEVDEATAAGCWAFGFVSYEAASGLDADLPGGWTPGQPPLVWFGLCDRPQVVPLVEAPPHREAAVGSDGVAPSWALEWSDSEYTAAVGRVREHIAAGDTFQCNLTDRLRSLGPLDSHQVYAALATAQQGAYNTYLETGDVTVCSASPELFFEWSGDRVRTRPMKGTAPRGGTPDEDAQHASRLRASAKEQAENIMIVDLLRNDLGRVAKVGSVHVDELLTLERYPTVWQLTSQVSAQLTPGAGLVDIFRALFPCGSVTGAPKRRTMQLIADLETGPRGIYCGAIGFIAPPTEKTRARFSVAIRTAVIDPPTAHGVYGVGSGITWSSTAAGERAELRTKTVVLGEDRSRVQVVETMGCQPGSDPIHLDRHLDRMARTARWAGFTFDRAAATAAVEAVARRSVVAQRLRLLLHRDGAVDVQHERLSVPSTDPVLLVIDDVPVDSSNPWLRHKTTCRDTYTSRSRRHPDADDVVILNEGGLVTETTVANIAACIDGRWYTPPVWVGCLPGVYRGVLVDEGELEERALTPADLRGAEAIAVLSSLRGWRTAVLVGCGGAPAAQPAPAATIVGPR